MTPDQAGGHALVVGGAQGLGSTVARLLAAAGHRVSVIDRQGLAAGAATAPAVEHSRVDILDAAAIARALEELRARHGPVRHALFLQRFRGEDNAWEGELATSLGATRAIVELLAPHFPADGASIVLVSSAAGSFVTADQPVGYHAAKGALESMARYWAVTLGPRGVRCNAVAPAVFRKDGFPADSPRDRALAQVLPLGRVPTAEEIARVVLFLCSPASACLTGQVLAVDGGISLLAQAALVQRLATR